MVKNNILLLIAHTLILFGCVSTMETVEKEEPVPKATVGMNKAEVLKTLNDPDFTSFSEGQTIFFYCTYLMKDTSKGTCTPIFFRDDTVVYVGEKNSQQWKLETVRFKVKMDRKKTAVKKEKKKVKESKQLDSTARDAKPLDSIAVETLTAQKAYTPNEGETVYVNYYTNFVRYIPLRSNPSNDGEILKTICIGSELGVLSVQDRWLYVEGVDEYFKGWILKQWVTNDRSVKIDAEKRRKERASEIARLEEIVKPIPRSKWRENLRLYEKLLALDPCKLYYQRKVDFYENYGGKGKKRKRK
jgi:hypothetical protein